MIWSHREPCLAQREARLGSRMPDREGQRTTDSGGVDRPYGTEHTDRSDRTAEGELDQEKADLGHEKTAGNLFEGHHARRALCRASCRVDMQGTMLGHVMSFDMFCHTDLDLHRIHMMFCIEEHCWP